MAQAIARARHIDIAPRKVRLVADMIRGKKVQEARDILAYTVKISAPVVSKVLEAAVANAENKAAETRERINTDEMVITEIMVDGGRTARRYQSAPRGRATRIRKRSSHLMLTIKD